MAIVTVSDFVGEIFLPNLDKEYVRENLDRFIAKYEPFFLIKLFGVEFYNDLKAGLEAVPVPEKWSKLVEGDETPINYKGNEVFLLNGIKPAIADFVYYWFRRDGASLTADIGETETKAENAKIVNSMNKTVRAWNEMCDIVFEARCYVLSYPDLYPYSFPWSEYWLFPYGYNTYAYGSWGCCGRRVRRPADYFSKINTHNI